MIERHLNMGGVDGCDLGGGVVVMEVSWARSRELMAIETCSSAHPGLLPGGV